jgi:hypothetical protein
MPAEMGARTPSRACLICRERETKANNGICWRCRDHPHVHVEGEGIFISRVGFLSHDAALRLAHEICDALTP